MLLGAFRPGDLLLSSTSTRASLEVVKLKHIHIHGKCFSELVKNSSGFESGVRALASLVKKGKIQFWAIVLQTTKTVQVAQTKVTITAAEKFSFNFLSRFLKSILDRCTFGENVSVESPAFGYVVNEDNMLRVKFFTLKAFRYMGVLFGISFQMRKHRRMGAPRFGRQLFSWAAEPSSGGQSKSSRVFISAVLFPRQAAAS